MKRHLIAAASAVAVAGSLLVATPAHADVIDVDQVAAFAPGGSIQGSVSWRNYYNGFGQVTISNDLSDGRCVSAQTRVARGGSWSGWTDLVVLCTKRSYTTNVYITSNNQVVQYWQFRVRNASSDWSYDTNSPGGA